MLFVSDCEVVFLRADSGSFNDNNGRKVDWTKIQFADPNTFENHDLPFRPSLSYIVEQLKKGDRVKLSIELEPTSKKSRAVVVDIESM